MKTRQAVEEREMPVQPGLDFLRREQDLASPIAEQDETQDPKRDCRTRDEAEDYGDQKAGECQTHPHQQQRVAGAEQ